MERVSNSLLSNNFLHHINKQQEGLKNIQNKLASHTKNLLPEDDPVSVSQFMKERTKLNDINRFERNINFSKGRIDATEYSLKSLDEVVKRAQELAIQGANGTYSKSDRYNMAVEIDQLLQQAVEIGNKQFQGEGLFGGTNTNSQAFTVEKGSITDPSTGLTISDSNNIQKVSYQGDNSYHFAELSRGEYVKTNVLGSEAFASRNQTIVSGTDGSNYVATQNQTIRVDGKKIDIKIGDNAQAVVDKMNMAGLNLHASIDNTSGQNLVSLNTSIPHQIALEDLNGGTVLSDLGLIASGGSANNPNMYAPTANVYTSNIFDELINLRNGLYHNDSEVINKQIGGLQESENNILNHVAKIGALQSRLEKSQDRLSQQKLYTQEVISKLNDLNVADAVVKLKNWETELQTSLQIGSKLLPKTLLEYLR